MDAASLITKAVRTLTGCVSLFFVIVFSLTQAAADVQQKWMRTFNGTDSFHDRPRAMVVDVAGNVYVTGLTNNTLSGAILLKYNKEGTLLWTRTFSGRPNAMVIDATGSFVYVTGDVSNNYFTTKISSSGTIGWISIYDENGHDDTPYDIAVDESGNVYVTGKSYTGTFQQPETADYATVKYNSSGVQQWVRRYNGAEPGNGEDGARSITLDAVGNIYVTGSSQLDGQMDFATVKYNPSGTVLWVQRYNGPHNQDDFAGKVMLDVFGNVYVAGTSETVQDRGDFDFFSVITVVKYTFSGFQLWAQQFSPPFFQTHNHFRDMEIDAAANVFISSYHEINAPGTLNTTKLNNNGVRQWTVTMGNPFVEGRGSYMAMDGSGNVYVTGISFNSTTGENFLTTLKYDTDGNQQWRQDAAGRRVGDDAKYGLIEVDVDENVYVSFIFDGGSVNDDDIALVMYSQCTLTCPPDITVNTPPGQCGAVVTYSPATFTGDCGTTFTHSPASGVLFPVGTTTVTATSTGTGATCTFTVTVIDNESPVLTFCPSDKTLNADPGVCYASAASVNAGTATATDNCGADVQGIRSDGLSLTQNYPVGITTITWTATDPSGNSVSCTQTITVIDNEPPVLSDEAVNIAVLSPPNHRMRDIVVSYTATDNCGVTTSLSVASNEPVNGTGDGDTDPDWIVVDAYNVKLRAERAAKGDGRIYTITITATDPSGNTATKTVEVRVPHDIRGPLSGRPFKVGSTVSFEGVFWDRPGIKHTAKWLIDGNTQVKGTVTEPSGNRNGRVSGSYKFNSAGVYKIQMNTVDQNNVTSYVTTNGDLEEIVVIYDPAGGYVYGGGWFSSPAGALLSNASATGKAGYGFTVNYFKNATYPKGETQFEFKVGELEFNAVNFDYLAIDKAMAQFRGTGKIIGGQSGLGFIMTVTDGDLDGSGVDRVRMKIYNKVTGSVIYDTQRGASDVAKPTTAIGAGSTISMASGVSGVAGSWAIGEEQGETSTEKVPTNYFLSQNHPNPFNPTTEIWFEVPVSGFVSLKVYDVLGREVVTLIDGIRDAGYGQVQWDAGGLPGGVYYVRMRAGEFTQTRAAVVMK